MTQRQWKAFERYLVRYMGLGDYDAMLIIRWLKRNRKSKKIGLK